MSARRGIRFPGWPPVRPACWLALLLLLGSCDLFSAREPEPPAQEGGTFLQPDTPEQVIENIQSAIEEMNAPNYGRSLAADLKFTPTPAALGQDPSTWVSWSKSEEERYFSTAAAAAQLSTGHRLVLTDPNVSVISDDRFQYDATYSLTINHNRPEVPTAAQGRLIWIITQTDDGLWSLSEWTDRELGGAVSWSDLKAAFSR
ncbi:MAG: hypothetical protein R2834_06220 [Rhodothermales bacterium]